MWVSAEVVSGVRIMQCHAIIDVVMDVRVMQCHASIDVVIGVRVMLCHQAIDISGFSTFLNFPLRIQNLILLSSCINSSSLFPVAILCTLLHRENTSFEVWYLEKKRQEKKWKMKKQVKHRRSLWWTERKAQFESLIVSERKEGDVKEKGRKRNKSPRAKQVLGRSGRWLFLLLILMQIGFVLVLQQGGWSQKEKHQKMWKRSKRS